MKRSMENCGDLERLLASRKANGADFWATPDGRLGIEQPISTLTALLLLSELGVPQDHEALQGAVRLVLGAIGDDGRARIAPKGTLYPCQTAIAAAALCRNGFGDDPRTQAALAYLLTDRYDDGGWRCKKFFYGRGPETEHSNPGVTLFALDAFRCVGWASGAPNSAGIPVPDLDRAVETLLAHWRIRTPIGPCHYGMGTLFMQTEFPFLRYNLFFYVYVLSFYPHARKDPRFREALAALAAKLDGEGRMVVERPSRKLREYSICREGLPSDAATVRYREILANMEKEEEGWDISIK